jgi:hypothetical protein
MCLFLSRAELELAENRIEDPDSDARVKLHVAFGGREYLPGQEFANRDQQLGQRGTAVQPGSRVGGHVSSRR